MILRNELCCILKILSVGNPSISRIICFRQSVITYPDFSGLEEFSSDKSKCQEHFDVYKECKKKEVSFNYFLSFDS
ncbi:hypothetical protein HanPI659440_Chr01g0023491 [Helianthus annuus]|nr:hypothetical protein HanPI659440_Chr01g0023491 [Helianthus annuus]